MQAIVTKYIPATNSRPSRIKATAQAGSVTIPYHFDENPHKVAALKLCEKFGWTGDMFGGHLPDGSVVWVFFSDLTFSIPGCKSPS